jgi:hypothetical protein
VLLCRIVRWGLPLGVTLFFAALVSRHMLYAGRSTWLVDSVFRAAGFVGRPILGFGYVAGILLLLQKEHWRRRLGPLKYAGRMALTNYLMQSLVFTAVSHSYGLGDLPEADGSDRPALHAGVLHCTGLSEPLVALSFSFRPCGMGVALADLRGTDAVACLNSASRDPSGARL